METNEQNIADTADLSSHEEWARQRIEAQRRLAYADPLTGSDSLFAESSRMKAMGESGWEQKQIDAVDRYNQIQQQYPWTSVK